MKNIRSFRLVFLIFLSSVAIFLLAAGDPPAPLQVSEEVKSELSEAFLQRFQSVKGLQPLVLDLFSPEVDTAFVTPDGKTAVLWLALRDDTGRIVATEPGLALAKKMDQYWQVIIPGDVDWEEGLASLPEEMIPLEQRPVPENVELEGLSEPATLSGYYLPYAAGTKQWLEGSISHFQYIPELGYPSCSDINGINPCRYAYDFTNDVHFPLLASKDGTVYASRDGCNDGDSNCTNYVVLKDTNSSTYQIYLHLSHGTIPDKLTKNTFVRRGQYIGDTDDTGYSTSNHVHFMVVDSIWTASGYYWGFSTDIRFADVGINGGIPRTCYEVTKFKIYDGATECIGNKSDPRNPDNDWFVSGNVGAFPPTGTITKPAANTIVTPGDYEWLDVTATASDDVLVKAVQLVAKLSGVWVELGRKITKPEYGNTYEWDVNLCEAAPVNGPLEVALRVWDHEGNVSSALNPYLLMVDHACPAPTSQLNPAVRYDSTATKLSWSAASMGAGLGSFELQWTTQPGTWDAANTMSIPGNLRSAWFVGQPGENYAFRLRALDSNGQPEPWPANQAAETSASLPTACVPDSYEEDDDVDHAYIINLGVGEQRNLCEVGDLDWFDVQIEEPGYYLFRADSVNAGAAVKITVYDEMGESEIVRGEAPGVGQATNVLLKMDVPGNLKIRVEGLVPHLVGTDAIYQLSINKVSVSFLPLINR